MNTHRMRRLTTSAAVIILMAIGILVAQYYHSPGTSPQTARATSAHIGTYPVSPDRAGSIALASAPDATITGAPMLVSYQGAIVYQITLSTGMVYVDATSGQVVPNIETITPGATTSPLPTTNTTPATTTAKRK